MAVFRVLYVDDEPQLLELGKLFLERGGQFTVDTITSAPAALTLLDAKNYDAIIADYQMPGMDGIEFLKKVRKSGNHIPFILFTGRGREEVVIQALNEGADFYLQKGGDPTPQFTELSHKIRQAIQKRLADEDVCQKNTRLGTINDLEREFAELPSGKRVEELAAKKLSELSSAVVTVFSTYYPIEQQLKTSVITFAPGILESLPGSWENVSRLMGMEPDKVFVPVSREMYQDINRSIVGRKNTITEISYGKIPPLVSASIQKLSGIDRFIHIAHVIDGELYGTSVIGLKPDRPDPSPELLDSFAHIVAVSLRRQRAELALRESEEFSRGLVENLPDYVVIYGSEGEILYANPAITTALGYSADELIGKPVLSYVAQDYRELVIANLASRRNTGILAAYEIVIMKKDGLRRSVIVQGSPIQYRTLPATLLVLTDITERSQADEAHRESEGKFRALVDQSVDGIIIVDFTGNLLFANNSAAKLTGYHLDAIGKVNVLDIISPEFRIHALSDFARVVAGTDGYLVQYKILTKGKKELWIECIGKKISFAGSSALILSIRDITERRQTEEEVRQQNLRLTTINELERDFADLSSGNSVEELAAKKLSALSGAVVTTFLTYDTIERVLRPTVFAYAPGIRERLPGVLEKVNRLLGKRLEDNEIPVSEKMYDDMNRNIIGMKKTITELSYGQIRPLVSEGIQKLSGIDRFIHIAHIIDGELYGASVIGLRPDRPDPSQDLLESFSHIVAVSLRRQRAEVALRESEEKFRSFIEQAQEGISIVDEEGRIIEWNTAQEKITGILRTEALGVCAWDLATRMIPDEHHREAIRARMKESIQETIRSGKSTHPHPVFYRFHRPDGTTAVAMQTVFIVKTPHSLMIGTLNQDVTEQQRAEEKIKESEEKYRLIADNTADNIWIFDMEFRLQYISPSVEKMRGFTVDEAMALPLDRHMTPDSLALVQNLFEEEMKSVAGGTGDPHRRVTFETEEYCKDGSTILVENSVTLLWDATGKPNGILGISRDITTRKRAELALRESEEKFRSLVEYALESILLVDFEGKILFANNAAARTIEMDSLKGLVGRNVMEFIAPESREDVIKDFMQVAQGHDAYLARYSAVSAQGKKIRLECIGKVISYEGKPADIISLRDITESEKAVDALKESEEKYRTLADHLPEYVFIHRSGILQYVNQAVTEITGRSSAELCGRSLTEFIAPESRAVVEENIRLRDQGNRQSTYEAAILVKDGEKRYGIVNSALISYEGLPASLVVISDITRRKIAEDALRRSNRQLSLLSSITRHDISNQLLTLNGFVTLLHGKMPDPALEKFFSRITEASKRITAMIQFTKEYEQIGSGSPIWQDLRALVNTAGNEIVFGRVVLKNDILSGTEIFADPLIVRVFFNLMDNALRHGGGLTTIRFSSETQKGDRIILCEDDGSGVIPVEKERIFDRGFGRNTGYGLAISREILDITGMTIRETGEPGRGARFEIMVPERAFRVTGV